MKTSVYEVLKREVEWGEWDSICLVGDYKAESNTSGIRNANDYTLDNTDRKGSFVVKVTKDKGNLYITVNDENTINTVKNEASFRSFIIASDFKVKHDRVRLSKATEDGTEVRDIDLTGLPIFPKPNVSELGLENYLAVKKELTWLTTSVETVRKQRNATKKRLKAEWGGGAVFPVLAYGKKVCINSGPAIKASETTDRNLKEYRINKHYIVTVKGNENFQFVPRAFDDSPEGLVKAEAWLKNNEARLTRLRHASRLWEFGLIEHFPEKKELTYEGITIIVTTKDKRVNEYPKDVKRTYAHTAIIKKTLDIEDLDVVVTTEQKTETSVPEATVTQ